MSPEYSLLEHSALGSPRREEPVVSLPPDHERGLDPDAETVPNRASSTPRWDVAETRVESGARTDPGVLWGLLLLGLFAMSIVWTLLLRALP